MFRRSIALASTILVVLLSIVSDDGFGRTQGRQLAEECSTERRARLLAFGYSNEQLSRLCGVPPALAESGISVQLTGQAAARLFRDIAPFEFPGRDGARPSGVHVFDWTRCQGGGAAGTQIAAIVGLMADDRSPLSCSTIPKVLANNRAVMAKFRLHWSTWELRLRFDDESRQAAAAALTSIGLGELASALSTDSGVSIASTAALKMSLGARALSIGAVPMLEAERVSLHLATDSTSLPVDSISDPRELVPLSAPAAVPRANASFRISIDALNELSRRLSAGGELGRWTSPAGDLGDIVIRSATARQSQPGVLEVSASVTDGQNAVYDLVFTSKAAGKWSELLVDSLTIEYRTQQCTGPVPERLACAARNAGRSAAAVTLARYVNERFRGTPLLPFRNSDPISFGIARSSDPYHAFVLAVRLLEGSVQIDAFLDEEENEK